MKKRHFSGIVKRLCVLLVFLTAAAALLIPASAESMLLGDADGDGEISILDATAIQRYLAELPTKVYIEKAADADCDGEVTIIDATAIQRWLAELPTSAQIGKPIEDEPEATEPPTTAPTEAPTIAPTEAPTIAPTEAPTIAPTEQASPTLPEITSLTNTASGIRVEWNSVNGAEGYAVLRKRTDSSWVKLGVTKELSYIDTTPSSGNTYIFKVRCVDSSGAYVGPNTDEGPLILYLKVPNLSSVTSANEGARVYFGTVGGAETYEILRRVTGGSFEVIGSTAESPFIDADVVSGTTYTYTVRAVSGNVRSSYNTTGIAHTFIGTPVMKSVANAFGGVSVEWEAVDGAQYYRLYRKAGDSGWTPKNVIEGTSFLDTDVYSGTAYAYTVRPVDAEGENIGGRDEDGLSTLYLKAPNLSNVTSANEGARVYFGTVGGAETYEILRRVTGGSFEVVGTAAESPFIDADVVSGTTYTYTVRAVSGNVRSSYNTTGFAHTFIGMPVMKSVANAFGGVSVEWEAVDGAQYYRLYRKADDSGWTPKNVIEGTSFLDTDVYSGTAYAYTVRPVDAEGENIGGRDEDGLGIIYLKAPELKKVDNVHSGVRVTFSTVAGADSYTVYRKTNGSYQRIGTTADGSFTDHDAVIGTAYTYTVQACCGSGSSMTRSACNEAGLTITAQDVSAIRYVARTSIGLYLNYSDTEPVLSVKYMTALTYLETTKEWDSGSWLKVEYAGQFYYVWVGAGEVKLVDEPSSFVYDADTDYQALALDTALRFLDLPTGYAHEDSTGVADAAGRYWFDCSGFAAYVMDTAMRTAVPTYNISANIRTLYETDGIYNNGYQGAFAAITVIGSGEALDESLLAPGDVIFFDLAEETEAQAEDLGYNHCGIYLGNGEFIHCTHSWGGGVCVMPLSGIYAENFVAARRYLPAAVQAANAVRYTTSQRTNLYAANNSNDDPIKVLGADVEVTLLFTDNGNWAYVDADGVKGFILVKYLTATVGELDEERYVAKTSVKLYESYDTSSAFIEVQIGTALHYNGRYSNSSYYKVTYQGTRYYIYAKDGVDPVLSETYEEATAVKAAAVVNANTWLRSAMNSADEDNKLYLARTGDELSVIAVSDSGTWAYVRDSNGDYGFILAAKLTYVQ